MLAPGVTVGGRYGQLEPARQPFLDRARECSRLTIPSLLPPSGHTSTSKLPTPYQSMGARGVNNLASKLLLALLPPNSPFFKLNIDDFMLEKLTKREGMRGEVEKALGSIERTVMMEIETGSTRVSVFEALKHLIMGGNVLLYLPPEGGMRVFHLDRFVVKRDPMGNVLETITKETVSPDMLPDTFRKLVKEKLGGVDKTVDIYTYTYRNGNHWVTWQEVTDMQVPGTRGTFPLDKSPWIPLRFTKIDGEDYGRGYVEEYLGDIRSLEGLSQAIVEGSAAAAKVLILVNPNGTTSEQTIAQAPNGAVRSGNADDVTVLQMQKYADFRIAKEQADTIEQRLAYAFLLNTAIQRNGERVTAEEIRYMANELEDALGGVYSILSQEFQLPLVNRLMFQLQSQQRLPVLPKGMVKPTITTGMEALGRGHDLQRLDAFIGGMGQMFGPEVIAQYVNVGDYMNRRGTALGIDMKGLIKTEEEVQAALQQAQQMKMLETLGPNAINAMGGIAKEGMKDGSGSIPAGG